MRRKYIRNFFRGCIWGFDAAAVVAMWRYWVVLHRMTYIPFYLSLIPIVLVFVGAFVDGWRPWKKEPRPPADFGDYPD